MSVLAILLVVIAITATAGLWFIEKNTYISDVLSTVCMLLLLIWYTFFIYNTIWL